jgi:hypothetical protein
MSNCAQAGPGRGTARGKARQSQPYHRHRPLSSGDATFSRRPDDGTALALGHLTLYLVLRPLPREERNFGWSLVAKWLAELVEGRHNLTRGAVA